MAISRDASAPGVQGSTSPIAWNHTVGASANHLYVGIGGYATTAYPSASAVTYNSVAMTLVQRHQYNDGTNFFDLSIWSLANPPVGTFSVSVTWAGGSGPRVAGNSASYISATTLDTDDGTLGAADTAVTGTHITANVTPTSDNCWLLAVGMATRSSGGLPTVTWDASTPVLQSTTSALSPSIRVSLADSNGAITPAAATSVGITPSSGSIFRGGTFLAIAIAPPGAGASVVDPFGMSGFFGA